MSARAAVHLRFALFGLIFGFALSRIGFSDFDEVHAMFVFSDPRLLFTFMGGVAVTMAGFLVMSRRQAFAPKHLHRGTIVGGVLFGAGWAITGACPSVALVQLGEGKLAGLWVLGGVLVGTWLYRRVHARFFGWDMASCAS